MSDTEVVKAALNEAVERLYAVFADYPLSSPVEGCECCATPERNAMLHAVPLRQLSRLHLANYLFDGVLTVGSVSDFKHLLPRLLELVAIDEAILPIEYPFVTKKLEYAHWRDWSIDEQKTVEHFFLCQWDYCITVPSQAEFSMDYLAAYAQAVDSLDPFLAVWQKASSPGMLRHLALAIIDNCSAWERFNAVAADGWWSSAQGSCARELKAWLASDTLLDRLESISQLLSDEKLSAELLTVTDCIRHWR